MIKKLHIKNFQSHTNSELEFHPGVNVIVGESQAGKTAILRALSWLVKNRPAGLRYKNRSSRGDVQVEMELAPGTKVTLAKNKTVSIYTLNGQEFSKFGADVPVEVEEAINIGDLNIQGQLDSPFLITDSSYQVSHAINKITKMEESDEWIQTLNSRINQNSQVKRMLQVDLEELGAKHTHYQGLEVVEELLERASGLTQKYREAVQLVNLLTISIRNLRGLKSKQSQKIKVLTVKTALEALNALDSQIQALTALNARIRWVGQLDKNWKNHSLFLSKLTGNIEKVLDFRTILTELQQKNEKIQKLISLSNKQSQAVEKLSLEKEQYVAILEQEGVCPTCFSKITKQQLISIMDKL